MRTCERCHDEACWPCDNFTLPGGMAACLCHPCQREYVLGMAGHALNERSVILTARREHYDDLARADRPVTEAERLALAREWDALSDDFVAYTRDWLAKGTS